MSQGKPYQPSPAKPALTRARDDVIDELTPEETERLGYIWVVKGTISEEEERQQACHALQSHIVQEDVRTSSIDFERVEELIRPSHEEIKPLPSTDGITREDVEPDVGVAPRFSAIMECRLSDPSFVTKLHKFLSQSLEITADRLEQLEELERPGLPTDYRTTQHIPHTERGTHAQPGVNSVQESKTEDRPKDTPTLLIEDQMSQIPAQAEELSKTNSQPPPKSEAISPSQTVGQIPQVPKTDSRSATPAVRPETDDGVATPGKTEGTTPPSQEQRPQVPPVDSGIPVSSTTIESEPDNMIAIKPRGTSQAEGYPFLKGYIMRKVDDLENKLKSLREDLSESLERRDSLKFQAYEMEVVKILEKISSEEYPSEEDVSRLERLIDQLKSAKGIKKEMNN